MLRVLTLASLFPNARRPVLGVFVERQTLGLAARDGVALEVAAPVGLPLWPLSRHPHYAPLAALPAREDWKGLAVHRPRYRVWPRIGQARAARDMAAALLPLLRAIRDRFPFDVIDAEFFWPDGPAAMHLSRALGIPFSIKARGSDIHHWGSRPGIREQIVAAGRRAGGLLAVSEAIGADMAAMGMPADRIRVHHTGVDLDRFRPVDRAAPVNGRVRLICVGALVERKGQGIALDALARLPDAALTLIGEGPDRARLEARARALGVAGRVRFLGGQPHEALPGLIAAAHVMVLPTASEGLANAWVESLACGTPVVTCDVGGAREAIDRPAAGRLVARAPEAIAAGIVEVLGAYPAPADVRAAAEKFSWDANRDALFDHLSGLAGG
jgi:glycosyltransferase involved in cell wall biosynthesis